jgi:Holliday junction resolvase RusA-like endonuclease
MTLTFSVYGVAQAKGNMRALLVKGMKYPVVTDSNRSAKSWSQLVAQQASVAIQQLPDGDRAVLDGAVRLTVAFYLPRPKKYQKRGLPVACLTAPDWDKLARAVGDALAGVAYHDDRQIVEAVIGKFYADVDDAPHATVRVEATGGIVPQIVAPAPLPLFEGVKD